MKAARRLPLETALGSDLTLKYTLVILDFIVKNSDHNRLRDGVITPARLDPGVDEFATTSHASSGIPDIRFPGPIPEMTAKGSWP
jgi:hypothetical protein